MSKVKIPELADKLFESVKVYVDELFSQHIDATAVQQALEEHEKKMRKLIDKKIKEAMK